VLLDDLHYNDCGWNDLHYNDCGWNDLHYNDCALFDAGGKLHPNKPVLLGFGVQRRR